jgi:hypothetical protein
MKNFGLGIVALIGLAALFFIAPLIGLLFGILTGWVLELVCGDYVANGLNVLFGTDRFSSELLPRVFGVLGVIGGFFKSTTTIRSDE